jgi:hypothetical protein
MVPARKTVRASVSEPTSCGQKTGTSCGAPVYAACFYSRGPRKPPVRTPISLIWALGATTSLLEPTLNRSEWTLVAWGKSLSGPQ